jgi:hypothetical protein
VEISGLLFCFPQGRFKEKGNDRREKLQSFDSPERKRIKYSRETDR